MGTPHKEVFLRDTVQSRFGVYRIFFICNETAGAGKSRHLLIFSYMPYCEGFRSLLLTIAPFDDSWEYKRYARYDDTDTFP